MRIVFASAGKSRIRKAVLRRHVMKAHTVQLGVTVPQHGSLLDDVRFKTRNDRQQFALFLVGHLNLSNVVVRRFTVACHSL
jgi:hypothetical protein